jgi:ribonucleoside-diphosphate reductase alpha subunit
MEQPTTNDNNTIMENTNEPTTESQIYDLSKNDNSEVVGKLNEKELDTATTETTLPHTPSVIISDKVDIIPPPASATTTNTKPTRKNKSRSNSVGGVADVSTGSTPSATISPTTNTAGGGGGGGQDMFVTKRTGKKEIVSFDKIMKRIKKAGTEAGIKINYANISIKIIEQLFDGISTTKIDELTAEQCASMSSIHPDYNILAGRILISNHHKNTEPSFVKVIKKLYNHVDKNGKHSPLISTETWKTISSNAEFMDSICDFSRDYLIDFFGFKTLEKSYLMRSNGRIMERPQHLWLRVAVGIHGTNFERVLETYHHMSQKYFIHATPTLYNAGTPHPQCSSCFLLAMEDDSIEGIYNTLKDCALISKHAGGIGLHIHNVRASGSQICGTNGTSNGIVPMLRVFNNTAKYVDQGGGKRNGSFAIYLELWHADIELFLEMRKNHGDEETKARDLFYALWMCDLFMKRVKNNEQWSLMCPNECKGLSDVYAEEFETLYTKYEMEGKARKSVSARDLWYKILDAQMETGTPYISFKDSVNRKSNQKNIGIIKSSNLCQEIMEVSTEHESAVCNLSSIGLPTFVNTQTTPPTFDFVKLHEVARIVTYNLNRIIDINFYPTDKTRVSNNRHRPIGIGIQGLADVFLMMGFPFGSTEARELNKLIFETIYHGALEQSLEMAKTDGKYETFDGSPASQGLLQFDLWGVENHSNDRYDWTCLKEQIKVHGLRNSLLLAPMPTASTSQILGFNECFEPITSNIYTRRTLAGEFIITNKYLMNDLIGLGMWNDKVKNHIIANNGSIQGIQSIPENIKEKYKTVWEIPMKVLIDMSADRGVYICQSQSLNLWLEDPNYNSLTAMHFYSWSKGLKTGIYYLRRRAKHNAQQFTIEPTKTSSSNGGSEEADTCEMCSA